jgi:hypothetical protein
MNTNMKAKTKPSEQCGAFFNLSPEERQMMTVLKTKHFINLSALLRQAIRDAYTKYENHPVNQK